MKRHFKLAVLLLPFLVIAGFIVSDIYLENKANQTKLFQLKLIEQCNIFHGQCRLKAEEFELNIEDDAGLITINTSFPLDNITLFVANKDKTVTTYPLKMKGNRYYWQQNSLQSSNLVAKKNAIKLRLIAEIKGGRYIAEIDLVTR